VEINLTADEIQILCSLLQKGHSGPTNPPGADGASPDDPVRNELLGKLTDALKLSGSHEQSDALERP
jgi:hypothetical protein